MTEPSVAVQATRSRGWWVFVIFVFALQAGAVFWLSDRRPLRPRQPQSAPVLHLAEGGCDELLELRDPTLFALPRQRGFSALAGSTAPRPALGSADWSEPPRWLNPKIEKLGAEFLNLPLTNAGRPLVTPSMPEPEVLIPDAPPLRLDSTSRLKVLCDDAAVRLVSAMTLPSWPARMIGATDAELLTNSLVQVLVGDQGRPISVSLLSSSGSGAADEYALREARTARFEVPPVEPAEKASVGSVLAGLHWCRLVFEWHTAPATNSPAAPP